MSVDKVRYGKTLFKLVNICKDILPTYNRRIYRILTNLNQNAERADSSGTLGFEDIGDVIQEASDLLSLHRDYNRNTMHGETKYNLGMDLVDNLRLAPEEEVIVGTSNDFYMTPFMAGTSIDINAMVPLNAHINNFDLPHGETAEKIGSLTASEIEDSANDKYLKTDQVANANFGMLNTKKNFATLLSEFRTNLPPGNFTSGLVDPRRVANGTPGPNTVVLSDNRAWTDISTLANDPQYSGRMIAAATFNDTFDVDMALAFIRTNQPYVNLPTGSIVLFTVVERLGSAETTYNNGHSGTRYHDVGIGHVAVKYSDANWQVL